MSEVLEPTTTTQDWAGPQTREEANCYHQGFTGGLTAYSRERGDSTLKSENPLLARLMDEQGWATIDTFERLSETPPAARVLTCVYCGHEYPQDTPAAGAEILTEHIRQCEKHPMRKLESDNATLRKALIGLVGADTAGELEILEGVIRTMPVPDIDKMTTINAIQALLTTM